MAIYAGQDIYTSFSGDIAVAQNGDIQLGTSHESHKAAINFLLRTDKGDYIPDIRIGCNLGTFIGGTNSKTNLMAAEQSCKENLSKFVIAPNDVEVHIIPMSIQEAGVFVGTKGTYVSKDGNLLDITPEVLSYIYPYHGGSPKPI